MKRPKFLELVTAGEGPDRCHAGPFAACFARILSNPQTRNRGQQ